ncbi:MAG: TatD family hydrolase [Acidobacteria bacterium]|nr:TatD family hydrolase [Acidobacteriota bacterium]
MLVDSHAHLNMYEPGELPGVLERAVLAGVGGIVVPATGPDDLEAVTALVRDHLELLAGAVGVHPHEASSLNGEVKERLERLLGSDGIVAIGEIGLDYHYMSSPREDQIKALEWQLDLAMESGLPVILHNRESWEDMESILASRAGALHGVCHSFSEGEAATRSVVEMGLYVGISGMVTFRRADNVREVVRTAGMDRILVETDSPYLAPVPHRGRRNEPAWVRHVAEAVALELELGVREVVVRATASARRLFRLPEGWGAV